MRPACEPAFLLTEYVDLLREKRGALPRLAEVLLRWDRAPLLRLGVVFRWRGILVAKAIELEAA